MLFLRQKTFIEISALVKCHANAITLGLLKLSAQMLAA